MNDLRQDVGREERFVRRYEYEDRFVVAADLPVSGDAVDVDVVGDVAIVVMDHGERIQEAEIGLPGPAADVDTTNGVLTVEVAK